jgi:hypothetical protein
LTGTADGRIYSYYPSTQDSNILNGEGHSNNVSGLATSTDGKVYSVAFDDHLREIEGDGSGFVYAYSFCYQLIVLIFLTTKKTQTSIIQDSLPT